MDARYVLIVDDNLELAENIAEILQLEGLSAEVVASAEDALARTAESAPRAIVTDYRLPGMNGAQLLRTLARAGVQARAVVISAYTDSSTMRDAEDAGAAFVPKPLDFETLLDLVRVGLA